MYSFAGRGAAVLLAVSATLSGCSNAAPAGPEPTGQFALLPQSELHGTLVNPPLPRPRETLRDTSGRRFSLANAPKNEVTVLFFGYTHCPDLCPTTMADLATARSLVSAEMRSKITVVFVTEDPERDTPRALRRWLDSFDTSFVGLMGGNAATKAMLKQLYLPQTKLVSHPDKAIEHPAHHHHGEYGVEHAGIVYTFGPGDTTLIYSGGTKPSEYASDFTRLLDAAAAGSDS